LLTSLPAKVVGASEVVRSYFTRWPAEELQFKSMKGVVSLNRVCGYGTQETEDEQVVEKQRHAARRIAELRCCPPGHVSQTMPSRFSFPCPT